MSEQEKKWGLFSADGKPVAPGNDWHKWKCLQQKYEAVYSECPISGEVEYEGTRAISCPFEYVAVKVDKCSKCGMMFIYP